MVILSLGCVFVALVLVGWLYASILEATGIDQDRRLTWVTVAIGVLIAAGGFTACCVVCGLSLTAVGLMLGCFGAVGAPIIAWQWHKYMAASSNYNT